MKTNQTTTAHTPKPWAVDYSDPCRLAIVDATGREIAFCSLQNEDGDLDEANAHLIAAAPTMLEALRLAESALSDRGRWVSDDAQEAYLACSQAIAKVEGRTF